MWLAPTLLWIGAGPWALFALVAAGLVASALLVVNVWPRRRACGRAWGPGHAPSRAVRLMLLWEWFRIYFESGVVKLASDPS